MRDTQEQSMTDGFSIDQIFKDSGQRYGFDNVTADFSPEGEMKVTWVRFGTSIDFWISDFLDFAPKDVLESLAETIFSKIRYEPSLDYSDVLMDFVWRKDFLERKRPVYMSRLNGVSQGPVGRHRDLDDSYIRLLEGGLIKSDAEIEIRWLPMSDSNCIGHSSTIMKTACVNRRLDMPFVSDEALDLCLFSQIKFIELGRIRDPHEREKLVRDSVAEYPDADKLDQELKQLGLTIWKEVSPSC
jgi:hypothetical protein